MYMMIIPCLIYFVLGANAAALMAEILHYLNVMSCNVVWLLNSVFYALYIVLNLILAFDLFVDFDHLYTCTESDEYTVYRFFFVLAHFAL